MSAAEAPKVLVETSEEITTVTINRPERRNAVDAETGELLLAAFDKFDNDDNQKVAILRSVGPTFCAGFDLKSLAGTDVKYDPMTDGLMGPTRRLLSKPVIAAIEGFAVAGGLELALWCDMRVAADSSSFGVFCRRWGVPLIDGGTIRLPRLIGHSRAMDMILTGREVAAEEALSFGLVNRLVKTGGAYSAAFELAEQLCAFPQTCMRTDRKMAYEQWGMDLSDALRQEAIDGAKPVLEEAKKGAARFSAGKGRGGNFSDI
jgi:enoyl-CoA hydratase/carnithine racemase